MLEIFRNYKLKLFIKRLLIKSALDIFTTNLTFDQIHKKYSKKYSHKNPILIYSILVIACYRTPASIEERILEVLRLYMENIEQSIISGTEYVTELLKLKSEQQFLKTKSEILISSEWYKKDKYSLLGMWYQMEQTSKGPISMEQWEKIKEIDSELKSLNKQE